MKSIDKSFQDIDSISSFITNNVDADDNESQ